MVVVGGIEREGLIILKPPCLAAATTILKTDCRERSFKQGSVCLILAISKSCCGEISATHSFVEHFSSVAAGEVAAGVEEDVEGAGKCVGVKETALFKR